MYALTPELHAIFTALLRERLGLHYGLDERALLGEKLTARAQDAGFDTLLDYYYHLRYDPGGEGELAELGEALLVHESYFFRERDQLEVVADVLAAAVRRGERPRVCSAACAAGEEPLSLAMLLDARGVLPQVELIASDVSARALARARAGVWSRRAVRAEPLPVAALRHLQVDAREVRCAPALIDAVRWRRVNRVVPAEVEAVGPCDLILCRNVLIYFDDATIQRVLATLAAQLRPGGLLFVGVSESLLRFAGPLRCEEHHGVFGYRRPPA